MRLWLLVLCARLIIQCNCPEREEEGERKRLLQYDPRSLYDYGIRCRALHEAYDCAVSTGKYLKNKDLAAIVSRQAMLSRDNSAILSCQMTGISNTVVLPHLPVGKNSAFLSCVIWLKLTEIDEA